MMPNKTAFYLLPVDVAAAPAFRAISFGDPIPDVSRFYPAQDFAVVGCIYPQMHEALERACAV